MTFLTFFDNAHWKESFLLMFLQLAANFIQWLYLSCMLLQ